MTGPRARTNDRVTKEGKLPAIADPMLLGITKASLATNPSFRRLFQETTGPHRGGGPWHEDDLRGLKENVIVGRLIRPERARSTPDRASWRKATGVQRLQRHDAGGTSAIRFRHVRRVEAPRLKPAGRARG